MREVKATTHGVGNTRGTGMLPLGIALALTAMTAESGIAGGFCTSTARAQYKACQSEVDADSLTGGAICINVADDDERSECRDELRETRREELSLCRDQLRARRELCGLIGEDRYEPDFDPAHFDDDFSNPTMPNTHFPLGIGNRWQYVGGDETTTIEVLDKTKLIDGVTCIVVNDLVEADGQPIEDTDDWFALAKNGDVYYCGESVRDFETFDGDMPAEPELVETEGSFKAGRDGDKPGILFFGTPVVGVTHRQEWSVSNAEDAATVLSTTYGYGSDPELDLFVPQGLANLLCAGDCVVIREFSPIDPGEFEHKYFAPDVGKFLEVKPEEGEVTQLVECNVHPKCAQLPTP
jgi:hypothetical protein